MSACRYAGISVCKYVSMYVSKYVCMFVCMYVCKYVCVYIYMYGCIIIYIYGCILYVCVNVRLTDFHTFLSWENPLEPQAENNQLQTKFLNRSKSSQAQLLNMTVAQEQGLPWEMTVLGPKVAVNMVDFKCISRMVHFWCISRITWFNFWRQS